MNPIKLVVIGTVIVQNIKIYEIDTEKSIIHLFVHEDFRFHRKVVNHISWIKHSERLFENQPWTGALFLT